MLTNMFIGSPPGNYDRILDFSRPATGTLFFVPSATFLEGISSDLPLDPSPTPPRQPIDDGSLGIGSLKGDTRHE
jgi:putative iron-dependent peroxidase